MSGLFLRCDEESVDEARVFAVSCSHSLLAGLSTIRPSLQTSDRCFHVSACAAHALTQAGRSPRITEVLSHP